ncbi:hypothetical protein [uncultured Halomonas sp.]|uniref:hypothetical protein n=1 Tax=uncultured Halomonas sp. TaxID=173971 RepID=UPI00261E4B4F|nr:hypothetical protein [uncultured Halomonas sp.]
MNADRTLWLVADGDDQTTDVRLVFFDHKQSNYPEPVERSFSFFADPSHRQDGDEWLRDLVVMILERL